jgi:hypothetical protein
MADLSGDMEKFARAVGERVAADDAPCESGQLYELLTVSLADSAADGPDSGRRIMSGRVRLHRRSSDSDAPWTEQAGDMVNDLLAISQEDDEAAVRALVYFTDGEMAGYLRDPQNGLHRLYDLKPGENYLIGQTFFAARPADFRARLRVKARPVQVISLLRRDYEGRFGLRVWQVLEEARTQRSGAAR